MSDRPDENDAYIVDSRTGYVVSLDGSHIGSCSELRRAEAVLYLAMRRAQYWPNVWRVNERGNSELCYFDSHLLVHTGAGWV